MISAKPPSQDNPGSTWVFRLFSHPFESLLAYKYCIAFPVFVQWCFCGVLRRIRRRLRKIHLKQIPEWSHYELAWEFF
jgi:hypothetical protein